VKNTGFFKKKFCLLFLQKTQILVLFSNYFFLWHCACEKRIKEKEATRSKNEVIFYYYK